MTPSVRGRRRIFRCLGNMAFCGGFVSGIATGVTDVFAKAVPVIDCFPNSRHHN
jgi:hypothetical protein